MQQGACALCWSILVAGNAAGSRAALRLRQACHLAASRDLTWGFAQMHGRHMSNCSKQISVCLRGPRRRDQPIVATDVACWI